MNTKIRIFDETIAQAKIIQEVMVQNDENKVFKKENKNYGYESNKSGAPNGCKNQVN